MLVQEVAGCSRSIRMVELSLVGSESCYPVSDYSGPETLALGRFRRGRSFLNSCGRRMAMISGNFWESFGLHRRRFGAVLCANTSSCQLPGCMARKPWQRPMCFPAQSQLATTQIGSLQGHLTRVTVWGGVVMNRLSSAVHSEDAAVSCSRGAAETVHGGCI